MPVTGQRNMSVSKYSSGTHKAGSKTVSSEGGESIQKERADQTVPSTWNRLLPESFSLTLSQLIRETTESLDWTKARVNTHTRFQKVCVDGGSLILILRSLRAGSPERARGLVT